LLDILLDSDITGTAGKIAERAGNVTNKQMGGPFKVMAGILDDGGGGRRRSKRERSRKRSGKRRTSKRSKKRRRGGGIGIVRNVWCTHWNQASPWLNCPKGSYTPTVVEL
jgi:hypothetical protein